MAGKNSTFCGAEPTWANACVGNNGNPGYLEYSKGFSSAANILIEMVISKNAYGLVDDLIYPVCFNMRHSVELRLKGAIEELSCISMMKGRTIFFDLAGSHDIGNIWKFFKDNSELIDGRYEDINKVIEDTIADIAEVDATGQTFRYPVSTESKRHLTDVAIISFFRLKQKFSELEIGLDQLHRLNVWLKEEYDLGTFTTKLSRPMIYRLADRLPPKSKWALPEFKELKQKTMLEFKIGSRDFSKAVDKIRGQYFLASLIGENLPLKGINIEQLIMFFDRWVLQNPNSLNAKGTDLGLDYWDRSESMLEEMKDRAINRNLVWTAFADVLTPEVLAGFSALFYFSRDHKHVELYPRIYEWELQDVIPLFKGDSAGVKPAFMHIFEKTNALSNMVISLFALGHTESAEIIVRRYNVDPALSWLEKSRNREMFSYPSFAGY